MIKAKVTSQIISIYQHSLQQLEESQVVTQTAHVTNVIILDGIGVKN